MGIILTSTRETEQSKMTNLKTQEIFKKVADALEVTVKEVVSRFENGDQDIVKWVNLTLKMHA